MNDKDVRIGMKVKKISGYHTGNIGTVKAIEFPDIHVTFKTNERKNFDWWCGAYQLEPIKISWKEEILK